MTVWAKARTPVGGLADRDGEAGEGQQLLVEQPFQPLRDEADHRPSRLSRRQARTREIGTALHKLRHQQYGDAEGEEIAKRLATLRTTLHS